MSSVTLAKDKNVSAEVLNKQSVLHSTRKNYEYKRGPQSRTVIKQIQQAQQKKRSENVYRKTLQALWAGITLSKSIYEPSVVHGEDCHKVNCKCTPLPNESRSRPTNDKRKLRNHKDSIYTIKDGLE